MKNLMNTVNSKINTAVIRANQALKNDNGMEVVQFLGVALLSITIAGLLVAGLSGVLDTTISNAGTKISGLFDFS